MKHLFLSLLFLISTNLFADTLFPKPQIDRLDNGLKIVWFLDDRIPVIDIVMLVNAGYREDPIGKSGSAELLSNVLDRGAGDLNARDLARSIETLGASRYISSDEDNFSLGLHGLSVDAPALLRILADIAQKATLSDVEIQREQQKLTDKLLHLPEYGEMLADLGYSRSMLINTPYSRNRINSLDEFKKLKSSAVREFYKTHFTPENTILLVVGKTDKEVLTKLIRERFSDWKNTTTAKTTTVISRKNVSLNKGNPIIIIDKQNQNQAQIRIGFPAPLITSESRYPLLVANALLGEYFDSRLNSIIRDKMGLTYSIGSGFSYSKEFARLTISTATKTNSAGLLIKKVKEILTNLKNGQISEAEIQSAKDYLSGRYSIEMSSLGAIAMRWLTGQVFGLGENFMDEYKPKINAVTRTDVISALSALIDFKKMVVVIAGDTKALRSSLKESGFANTKQLEPSSLL